MFKDIFKKKETDEEAVELTPEEKKEKTKKIGKSIVKTVGMVAAGAACVLGAIACAGRVTSGDSEGSEDDTIEGTCEDCSDSSSEE